MEKRGRLPNLSTFAFTATPKPKTLELFGTKRADGKFAPFHLYSMRQAIEEGFILDVLANYTTYKAYWRLLKKIEDDPRYDKKKAEYLLKSFVELHPHAIGEKVRIMVEHFAAQGAGRDRRQGQGDDRHPLAPARRALQAGGRQVPRGARLPVQGAGRLLRHGAGRRPVVHRSRDERLPGGADRQDVRARRVPLPDRRQQVPDRLRPAAAAHDVRGQEARRRERGADAVAAEPHASPDKKGTMVLDFANEADEIKAAFEPYYETTLLSEATDPNLLYEIQSRLAGFPVYTEADVDAFAKVYFDPEGDAGPALRRAGAGRRALPGAVRGGAARLPRPAHRLRAALRLPRAGPDLRRRRPREAVRLRAPPAPAAPGDRDELPREVQQNIDMESYRIQQTGSGKIALERRPGVLDPRQHQGQLRRAAGRARDALAHHRRAERALRAQSRPGAPGDARPDDGEARRRRGAGRRARGSTRARTCASPSTRRSSTSSRRSSTRTSSSTSGSPTTAPSARRSRTSCSTSTCAAHRNAEELIKRGESKTLEFKSTLRWNLKENRQDDKVVTHAVLKTIAAFLNTEGGDLLIGVADDGSIVGIEHDQLENDDKFMRHLAQVVRNGLGDRAGTCIDPKTQIVQGKTVCVVSCQRSPEPVFLKWKGMEATPEGDFFVRSGPGTVKLPPESAREYIRTRFQAAAVTQVG